MKKLLCLLLSLTLLLSLWGCRAEDPVPSATADAGQTETTAPTDPEGEPSSPLLYKVTDGEGHVLYLFGSIHIGIEEMYPLPDYVIDAYESSDLLAVEIDDLDAEEQELVISLGELPDGTVITDYIPEKTYQAALAILEENGAYAEEMEHWMPVVWKTFIEELTTEKSPADADLGVDRHMMERARQDGKPIEGIETIEYHYRVMSDLSMETQCLLLEGAVEGYRSASNRLGLKSMCEAWAAGVEAAWEGASVENILANTDEALLPLYQEYYNALQTERDLLMTQYAKDALASGETVFICVGTAHVVPGGAMIDQLRAAGYTVERVEG